MKDLALLFGDAGCRDVQTYIQSGNVVFRADAETASRVPERVSEAVAERFGFSSPIVLRTLGQLEEVAGNNPFLAGGVDEKTLHVMFLSQRPTPEAVASLDPDRSPPDAFVVRGSEIYLRFPKGSARTKLTSQYFDSRLNTIGTARNWRTVTTLLDLGRRM